MLNVKDWLQSQILQAKNPQFKNSTIVSLVRIKDDVRLSVHGGKGLDGIVNIDNKEIKRWASIYSFSHDLIHMTYELYNNSKPTPLKKITCEINDFELSKINWNA